MLRSLRRTIMALPLLLTCAAACSQTLAPYPTAKLTVNGSETAPGGVWDSGNITIDFNGYVEIVNYGQYSNAASLASALAASFTRDYVSMGLYAKAGAHGPLVDPTVITFQLVNGNSFAPINIVDPSPSFSFSATGFTSSAATVVDRGTATLTVAGTTVTANYGDGSTAATIAQDLALKANSPLVTVTAESGNLYLRSKQTTGSFSYPYSLSFSTSTSFSSSPASGSLTGSTDAAPVTVYSYSVTNSSGGSGYAANGNLLNVTDSVMGTWTYGYDNLNRLVSGTAVGGPYANQYTCWSYDSFGNRTSQSVSTTPCASSPPATFAALYSTNNQISSVTSPANLTISYDAAGNVTNDGYNTYTYDAEGRVCALHGPDGMIGYQYDADGNRVGKGTITTMSCDITSNGYQPMTDYVLDLSGGQMSEVGVGGAQSNWVHTNVTANGMLIATYDTLGLHFYLNDALGSRRAQTDPAGFPEQTCQSLPFGDQLYCTGSLTRPTEHHFTGKERDAESGLDYFGARYYASNMGRFMSPDPIIQNDLRIINPQRWNKYSYAINSPLVFDDPSGKDAVYVNFNDKAGGAGHSGIISVHPDGSATYSSFGPKGGPTPYGDGAVQTDTNLPSVQFGADGLPTPASYGALINAVAGFEKDDPSNVGTDYFKTSPAETAALDAYIKQRTDASNAGKAPKYCVIGNSCRDYALGGLKAAGINHGGSVIPNHLFLDLLPFADAHTDPEAGHKKNTGPPVLKRRDGSVVQDQ